MNEQQAVDGVPDVPHYINAVSLKLPPFWTSDPDLWFVQVESQFLTRTPPINNDLTRFHYVVGALDSSTCKEVASIIRQPPQQDAYLTLKNALIDAFGASQHQRNVQLLTLAGLGDRKPSALLRHIHSCLLYTSPSPRDRG